MISDLTQIRFDTRKIAAMLASALLGIGMSACGSTNSSTTSATSPHSSTAATTSDETASETAAGPKTSSGHQAGDVHDGDDSFVGGSVHEKNDDISVVDFGHEASQPEREAIAATLRRYYEAAATHDGATACRLITTGLVAAIPKQYRDPSKPSDRSKSACAYGLSRLLASSGRGLKTDASGLAVTGVRVEGNKGYALLKFKGNPEPRVFAVEREGGTWKLEEFLDGEYP